MIFSSRRLFGFALCLTLLAGFIDALGFIRLGGVFLSFMSGNSTRLSVMSLEGSAWNVILLLMIIGLFVIGVAAGSFVARHAGEKHAERVLALVSVLLTAAAASSVFSFDVIAVGCMTLAMGAANMTFAKQGEAGSGITYMTGTLVKIGQSLAARLDGDKKAGAAKYAALWLSLLTGAVLGTLCYGFAGMASLWCAAVFSFGLYLAARKKFSS